MFDQYQSKIFDASHLAHAYKKRAEQLVFWERLSRFMGLGVAPGIILGAVAIKFNSPVALNICLIVSGLLSLTIWIWAMGSMAFKLDLQLERSRTIPFQCKELKEELQRIGGRVNWNNLSSDKQDELKDLMDKIDAIRKQVEKEQIHVTKWMNMWAQQQTMIKEKAECISCKQKWKQDHEFTEKEIKTALKLINKDERLCPRCGQPLGE